MKFDKATIMLILSGLATAFGATNTVGGSNAAAAIQDQITSLKTSVTDIRESSTNASNAIQHDVTSLRGSVADIRERLVRVETLVEEPRSKSARKSY